MQLLCAARIEAFVFIAEGFFLRSKKCVAKKQSKHAALPAFVAPICTLLI
jgi:hypothetical protein